MTVAGLSTFMAGVVVGAVVMLLVVLIAAGIMAVAAESVDRKPVGTPLEPGDLDPHTHRWRDVQRGRVP